MNVQALFDQLVAQNKFDANRSTRAAYFLSLIKNGVDGLAGLGVVVKIEVDGLEPMELGPPAANPLESLELAIALMQQANKEM